MSKTNANNSAGKSLNKGLNKGLNKAAQKKKSLSSAQVDKILERGLARFATQIPQSKFTADNKVKNIARLMKKSGQGQSFFSNIRWISQLSEFKFNAKWPSLRIAGPVAAVVIAGVIVYNLKNTQNQIEFADIHLEEVTDNQKVALEDSNQNTAKDAVTAAKEKIEKINQKKAVDNAKAKLTQVDAFLNSKEKEILATKRFKRHVDVVDTEKVMGLPEDKKDVLELEDEAQSLKENLKENKESVASDYGDESSLSQAKSQEKNNYDDLKKSMLDKMKKSPGDKELYLATKKFFQERNDQEALTELDKIYKP